MAVNGNAIHTGAKPLLQRDVNISEVRNIGVPQYILNVPVVQTMKVAPLLL